MQSESKNIEIENFHWKINKSAKTKKINLRLGLVCESLNIFKIIQQNQKEQSDLINSGSLILEIADLMLNAIFQLSHNEEIIIIILF